MFILGVTVPHDMGDSHEGEIVHRELNTEVDEPVLQVAEKIAELENNSVEEMKPTYTHLDHVLDYIFANPPVPEAQVEITFSYEGYRITVEQDGSAKFIKIS